MKSAFKILKIVGAILVLIATSFATYLAYDSHESNKKKEAELHFASKKPWQWHDEYNRVQIRHIDEIGRSVLRKVYISENYVVYARKNDGYELETMIRFITKCKPNTTIETSKKYSDGKPITLECDDDGDGLTYSAAWHGKNTDLVWNEDIDGFKFYVNFGDWDFKKLDQEITLSKAK